MAKEDMIRIARLVRCYWNNRIGLANLHCSVGIEESKEAFDVSNQVDAAIARLQKFCDIHCKEWKNLK